MKPFTITIGSPAAASLFEQFIEATTHPNPEKWIKEIETACAKQGVEHPLLNELTQHRKLMIALSKRAQAGIQLGVDITIDDNAGFMENYEEVADELHATLKEIHLEQARKELLGKVSPSQLNEFLDMATKDPDCPPELLDMIKELRVEDADGGVGSDVLDELAKEGKNVVKFPTGRKDN